MQIIGCVFLDLGRVLVDLDLNLIGARIVEFGVRPEDMREAVMRDGLVSDFETGRLSEAAFHAEVCRRLGKQISQYDFYSAWNSIFLPTPILPDSVIARLAAAVPLWTLSNTNSAHHRYLVAHHPFFRHFSGQILSFEAGFLKPDARIFIHALEQCGARAENTLFVDDLLPNVEAASTLGMNAFQFTDPEDFIAQMRSRQLLE